MMCKPFSSDDTRMAYVMKSTLIDSFYIMNFVSGLIESVASKFLVRVAYKDIDVDDEKSEDKMLPIARLRFFHRMVGVHATLEEIRQESQHVHSLLTPSEVEVTQLNTAMAKVISPKPGPMLKPFLSGGPPATLLARAVDVLEKRENEKKHRYLLTKVETDLAMLDEEKVPEEEISDLLEASLKIISELEGDLGEKSRPADIARLSAIAGKYDEVVRKCLLFYVASEFKAVMEQWSKDVRETGKSDATLDRPAVGIEDAKDTLLGAVKKLVKPRQFEAAEACYDAQEVFSKILVPDLPTATAAELMAKAKDTIFAKRDTLRSEFDVVVPDDFEKLLMDVLGQGVAKQLEADVQAFASRALAICRRRMQAMAMVRVRSASCRQMSSVCRG